MQRVLSTYRFLNQPLSPALLAEIAQGGFPAIEIFCSTEHFDYREPQTVREMSDAVNEYRLTLHSLHSPTERVSSPGRDSGIPISISDPERIRRLDAVDEIKRALDVAERIPFRYLIQHMGHGHQSTDPRKLDAAFTSLETLSMFAKARGVTIALENTTDELGSPSSLQHFIADTHLHDLKLCFDSGHAHLEDGVTASFDAMRDRIVTTHIHDNHGEKDEHLLPFEGTLDWDSALAAFARMAPPLPMVFELKAQQNAAPQIDQIRAAFDKFEEKLSTQGTEAERS